MKTLEFKSRARAAGWHLLSSVALVGAVVAWTAWAWFPHPYYWVSGGLGLFGLIAAVDVTIGPLLTFTVFSLIKPRTELRRDLAVVVTLQLVALLYGVWTLSLARPVYLVHEVDRFQVVTAADVRSQTSQPSLPWTGIRVIGVSKSSNLNAILQSIDLAMQGQDLALRADRWVPLNDSHLGELKIRGHDLVSFMRRHPHLTSAEVHGQLAQFHANAEDVRVFPLVGRVDTWSLMFDLKQRAVVGYLPVDGF